MKTIKQFAAASHINESLIRAVIRQCGGWDSFKEIAQDVTKHGADAGFHGFIYYIETVGFYQKNREIINEFTADQARDFGMDSFQMVSGFNCLRGNTTSYEVAETMYGPKKWVDSPKGTYQVANALAWFALEEVCRSYVDCCDQ